MTHLKLNQSNQLVNLMKSFVVFVCLAFSVGSYADSTMIDINTADAQQLSELTRIGLKKAEEIVAYRKANGLFISIDDLVKVKGIGKSTLEKNRHRMIVAKQSVKK